MKQPFNGWRSPLQAVFNEMLKDRLEKSERTPPVSWRLWATAAIDSTTFHACQRCRKTAVLAVFFSALGCHFTSKSLRYQQCQFLTRNKRLTSENEPNCSMTSVCLRTDSILPWGAGHGRRKRSFFSLSIFLNFSFSRTAQLLTT